MRGESTTRPGKRPLRSLSAAEKMEAIQRVHEGESKASVARDIGVPESTLRGWCKSEHKIRGMARNSSTPDSEAHSPASSSGTNLAAAMAAVSNNHSSEDEGPSNKRPKIDQGAGPGTSMYGANENNENDARFDSSAKIDYVTLMASMAGMRPENSALLLQHLGLLSGVANGNFAKSLLSLQAGLLPHNSTVGLVENGLQYTKGRARHSSSAVVAPVQMETATKSSARKSLPATEAPSSQGLHSPRSSGSNENGGAQRENNNCSSSTGSNATRTSTSQEATARRTDESLWNWLTQQQHLMGQQSVAFNPNASQREVTSFWKSYKAYADPTIPVAIKSPSKAKALIDNVLCNNNNDNVRRCLNVEENVEEHAAKKVVKNVAENVAENVGENAAENAAAEPQQNQEEPPITAQEAIEHGEKFFKWLDECSDPSLTRFQLMQFKYLLYNLKACNDQYPYAFRNTRK